MSWRLFPFDCLPHKQIAQSYHFIFTVKGVYIFPVFFHRRGLLRIKIIGEKKKRNNVKLSVETRDKVGDYLGTSQRKVINLKSY